MPDNLLPIASGLARMAGCPFDESDLSAIEHGLRDTDQEVPLAP
ncbi:MAG TPA: hypothetical protein VGG75_19640 [Trebonia sp.]